MTFLKNCWYMAGWSSEVPAGALISRKLAGEALVMFRDQDGAAHAMANRCPHRFAPLHLGKHLGDRVQCAYHGLVFDSAGGCVHNPHGDGHIPPDAKVRTYPLAEAYGCLWAWMGESDLADTEMIPDFSCLDDSANYVGRGYLFAKANYKLETDNIMDLSHIDYLHPGTLGGAGVVSATTSVTRDGATIWSRRLTSAEILPEFLEQAFGVPHGQPVDRRLDVRWDPPSTLLIFAMAKAAGRPDSEFRGRRIANIFSPETEYATHYWFAISYDRSALGENGRGIAQRGADALRVPFLNEDLPMLEAVDGAMEGADFWSLRPIILPTDAGAVQARRMLDKLIRDEDRENGAAQPDGPRRSLSRDG